MIVPKDQQIQALLSQRAFQSPSLRCGSGHKIERFCSNEAYKYDSLCCEEESCECESQHQLCSFKKLRQLNKSVQQRLSRGSKILRRLFSIQNELVNRLMASRKLIIQKSKGWKLGNYSEIIDSIYFKNVIKGIRGKQMKDLFSDLSEKTTIEQQAEQYLSSYKGEGEQMVSRLEKLRSDLLSNMDKDKKGVPKKQEKKQQKKEDQKEELKRQKPQILLKEQLQIDSKILMEDRDGPQKCSFLMKQLGSSQLKLLFRASQHYQVPPALRWHQRHSNNRSY